jgi:DNA-binding CsgD family transcriptional regulator
MRLAFVALARGQVEAAAEALSAAREALSDAPYQDQYHLTLAELTVRIRLAADGPAAGLDEAIGVTERYDLSGAPPHGWPLAIALADASVTALRAVAGEQAEALAGRSVALLGRLQALTGGLAADGPLQRAYRLTLQAQVATASRVQDRGAAADRAAADRSAADRSAADRAAADRVAAARTARTAWDEAAGAWEALRQPYERAIALTFAAEAELASPPGCPGPDREAAGERLRTAALLAAHLDAQPLADTITSLARRAGVALGDKTLPSPGRAGLTDREFEVLRLVAAGRSNRDIAADLFISAKTASVHVSNIMAKLGAANRTEAASIAHSHQLV